MRNKRTVNAVIGKKFPFYYTLRHKIGIGLSILLFLVISYLFVDAMLIGIFDPPSLERNEALKQVGWKIITITGLGGLFINFAFFDREIRLKIKSMLQSIPLSKRGQSNQRLAFCFYNITQKSKI